MTPLYLCPDCYLAVRVIDDALDGSLTSLVGPGSQPWGQQHVCPHCDGQRMQGVLETELDQDLRKKLKVRDLEPSECYVLLSGGGMPEDKDASPLAVSDALLNSRVVSVDCYQLPNTTRTVVTRLVFDNGTRMYFGAGPQGAVVYRLATRKTL